MIHDDDTKFTAASEGLFQAMGIEIAMTPLHPLIANAFAELWIGTLKRKCLNHFYFFSLSHLDHIVQRYAKF